MSTRAYKPLYEGQKTSRPFSIVSLKSLMHLLKALFKPQLPKAFHCKRDKEMRKENIAAHRCKIYIEKTLITLSTKPINIIVIKPSHLL